MSATTNGSYLDTMTQDCECYSAVFLANARAELAALRKSVATLTAQNAEQARQLEEARKIMQHFSGAKVAADRQMALDWLSAAAPAPQDAQP